MTIHPLLDPCSPPSTGRGRISDPGLYKLMWSIQASEEVTLFAETIAPYKGNTLCLMGVLGKGLELCRQRSPPSSSQDPRSAQRKFGGSSACGPKQVHSLGWIQQKVAPAFVLAEHVSSQESKRYLGALRLQLWNRATACSWLSPFCNAPQAWGREQMLPADRDVSAAPCKLWVSEAPCGSCTTDPAGSRDCSAEQTLEKLGKGRSVKSHTEG